MVVDVTVTVVAAVVTTREVVLDVRLGFREVLVIVAMTVDVTVVVLAGRVVVLVVSQYMSMGAGSPSSTQTASDEADTSKPFPGNLFHIFAAAFSRGANRPKILRLSLGPSDTDGNVSSEATGVKP